MGIPRLDPSIIDRNHIVFDDPTEFTHESFTLSMTPIEHNLCGDIKVTATFDGLLIELNEMVLSYDALTNTFTVDTDDSDLIGEAKPYSLSAELVDYPIATYPNAAT